MKPGKNLKNSIVYGAKDSAFNSVSYSVKIYVKKKIRSEIDSLDTILGVRECIRIFMYQHRYI